MVDTLKNEWAAKFFEERESLIAQLEEIRKALDIAANHKYGDGDYTAMFEKALAKLVDVINKIEGNEND